MATRSRSKSPVRKALDFGENDQITIRGGGLILLLSIIGVVVFLAVVIALSRKAACPDCICNYAMPVTEEE